MSQPWDNEWVIQHSQRLRLSFRQRLGRELWPELPDAETPDELRQQAQRLFEAPIIIVSHGTEADPIFNYGNARALALWELSWEQFTQLPSRKSAQSSERPERAGMLAQARQQGYFEGYVGDRTTSSGRDFRMEDGIIWTVTDANGICYGQAATFSQYHFL